MSLFLSHLSEQWPQLLDFYARLTHQIIPGPNSGCYFLPFVLLPGALLIHPSVLSHEQLAWTFLPLIYACQVHAWYTAGMDVISFNLTLWALVLLALKDPRKAFRRIVVSRSSDAQNQVMNKGKSLDVAQEEEPYPNEMGKRIRWVLTLLVSLRLTSWKINEPKHDNQRPPMWLSRTDFFKHALRTSLLGYLILDLTSCYAQTDPYFHVSGIPIDAPFPDSEIMMAPLMILRYLPPRLIRASMLAGQIFATVRCMFYLPVIPILGLNAIGLWPDEWSPHTWPKFFGKFSSLYTKGMRGLWGSWWHQLNRHITATPGRSLAQVLHIPTNSFLGYAMLTISAFFLSGVMHMGMIPPEPKSELLSAHMMRLYIGGFFWAQIVAFGIELAVAAIVTRFAPGVKEMRVAKALTLIWVACWLALTVPILTVPFREIGYWHYHAMPISILQGMQGQGWTTWPILSDLSRR